MTDISTRRVGFVAWNALPAVFPPEACKSANQIGGAETAMWAFAHRLAGFPDMEVSFFLSPIGLVSGVRYFRTSYDGVAVDVHPRPWESLRRQVSECIDVPKRRIYRFHPQLFWQVPALVMTKPFRSTDPAACQPDPRLLGKAVDLWVTANASADSSRVIATARSEGGLSLLSVQSNADLDCSATKDENAVDRYGERAQHRSFCLRHADEILVQTKWQQEALRQRFGRQSTLVRNPIDLKVWQTGQRKTEKSGVLWVGRYDRFHKQPLLMIETAKLIPEIPVTMIVNRADDSVRDKVLASRPPNVTLVDYASPGSMPNVFASARVFVSTGSPAFEGFPNVLLQAAASHTPIVSIADYDDFIVSSGAGVIASGIEQLAEAVRTAWQRPVSDWTRVDDHLRQHHAAERVTAQVHSVVRRMLDRRSKPS